MNTLQLLAFLRGYITYIYQVPVKHYLSTDIVLITQNLRKKIRQGKTYFKGTSILLKKRCKISAQNLLKKADSSSSLWVLFEDPSTLRRTSVASSSGTLRMLFDCASGRSRSVREALPKPSRRSAKPVSNMSRRSLEAEPNVSRPGEEVSPTSDFCLINSAPASAFHAIGIEFSSGSHRATPIETRCGLDEKPMESKNSAGIAQKMVDYSLAQETHKLDSSATLGSPLLSPCYTQGQLNDCTIPTQQKQAFQQVGDARLTYGVESERSVLRFFKSICKALKYRVNTLLGSIGLVVQQALKCFLFVADYKRAYRMVLSCLFLCLVSMFSLSAQTPRKDSGADGLSQIKALNIGDKIPQSLWDTPLDVINNPNGQKTIKLSEYRNKKLIILDFWASWCGSCIENMEHVRSLEAKYKVNTVFLKVNSFSSKDSHERIVKVFDKFKSRTNVDLSTMEYIFRDSVLEKYFPHVSIPHIVWIYDGKYIGSTYAQGLTSDAIDQVLHNKPLKDHLKNDRIGFQVNIPLREQVDLDEAANPVVEETFTGYIDGLDPDYGTFHKNDKTYLYRTVNIPLKQLYVNAFSSLFRDVPSWAISVDSTIANPVYKALNNLALRNDAFCFEVASSDTLTNEDILQRLRYCLLSNFKVTPVRTIEKASYWQLEVVDEKRVKESVRFFNKKGNNKYITFEELKSKMYSRLQLPINDLTTVKSNLFEIEVPKKLDWTDVKSIQDFLVTKGIQLKRVEKDIPTITFKKS
ncbi:thiol-disulfide oxidoreductase [compost metagenome]